MLLLIPIIYLLALKKWGHALILFITNSIWLFLVFYYLIMLAGSFLGAHTEFIVYMHSPENNLKVIGITITIIISIINLVVLVKGIDSYQENT